MKILRSVVDIMNAAVCPYEIGGLLGSRGEEVIDEIAVDAAAIPPARRCSYTPDVERLNRIIAQWSRNGIALRGVFHTHFAGVRSLSAGDKKYIQTIMEAMPACVEYLYFPIYVIPDRVLVCYKAVVVNGWVDIREENVTLEEKAALRNEISRD